MVYYLVQHNATNMLSSKVNLYKINDQGTGAPEQWGQWGQLSPQNKYRGGGIFMTS